MHSRYVDRLREDLRQASHVAARMGGQFEREIDSVYLGGGTPTVLPSPLLESLFHEMRNNFDVLGAAEVTVECAPGTLSSATLETLVRCGVNRVSLGAQSMVDREAAAVGRLHTRATVLDDIARLREAGIHNINIDLIAGLAHQTAESWDVSLNEVIATGVPHVSVYMLEVDDDSRLGREVIAGGSRYHAHFVPNDDAAADFYLEACRRLEAVGVRQYEISNFAREGWESRHNLKYWTRQPYLGFGVDAHSMLKADTESFTAAFEKDTEAVRFSTPDTLEEFLSAAHLKKDVVSRQDAREEIFFLGLRLNKGVDLDEMRERYGLDSELDEVIAELCDGGLLNSHKEKVHLTERGRLLSNEVFERFIADAKTRA